MKRQRECSVEDDEMRRSNTRAMTVASATSAVLFIIAAVAVVCARRGTRTALYGVGSEDWWSNQNFDSYDDQMSRGGRQSWEGHADTFWNGEVASDGMGSPEEGNDMYICIYMYACMHVYRKRRFRPPQVLVCA
jgi:hypothetical protein